MLPLLVQVAILIPLTIVLVILLLAPSSESPNDGNTQDDPSSANTSRVHILVLGDIARSPRMRNHATSFARHNVAVDLIGSVGGCDATNS